MTTLAGASLRDRLTHSIAPTDVTPPAKKIARSPHDGVTQPIGAITRPKLSDPANCVEASTTSGTARSVRVSSIKAAKARLPHSAISAGQVKVWGDGCRAI